VDRGVIQREEREALFAVYQHFYGLDDDTSNDTGGTGHGARGRKRRRDGPVRPPAPWGRFTKLETLSLNQCARQYLPRPSPDSAAKFLGDQTGLKHLGLAYSKRTAADAFIASHKYTRDLAMRSVDDNVRWCFSMLLYFDLVMHLYPTQSGKVGAIMLQEIQDLFKPSLANVLSPENALRDLNSWSWQGKKINDLCLEFGVGCLFFLGDVLSQDLYVNICHPTAYLYHTNSVPA